MTDRSHCRACGVRLTSSNRVKNTGKRQGYICKPCHNADWKDWHHTPIGKDYARNNYLWQVKNGKLVGLRIKGKRKYTAYCEVCGRRVGHAKSSEGKLLRRLVYHHWDDNDYSLGLWLCQRCHNVAHSVEQGLHEMYIKAKEAFLSQVIKPISERY